MKLSTLRRIITISFTIEDCIARGQSPKYRISGGEAGPGMDKSWLYLVSDQL